VTVADTAGFFDLRDGSSVRAGALAWESPDVVTGWHHHPYHQLEYALAGVAEVDTHRGRYLLPPRQALWIPAGVVHNTTLRGVRSVSVFFHPDDITGEAGQTSVIAVAPVLREMIHFATRWPINRRDLTDNIANSFFETLALLVTEALRDRLPLWLPAINDPVVAAVVARTTGNHSATRLTDACREVGISERTLRRQIQADIGMTWSDYMTQARLMQAMALLASTDRSVIDIATSVGFASPSGFTRAFRKLTGTNPHAYRSQQPPRQPGSFG
jgi:AraC-like DNA-binding protein